MIDGFSVQLTLGDPGLDPERSREVCVEFAELQLGADLAASERVA